MAEKKRLRYAAVILNYNTFDDAVRAACSIRENAVTEDYLVCIADNASPAEADRTACREYRAERVITTVLEKNGGYAAGNNAAIRFLLEEYNPDYLVIMNPDVLLQDRGSIEAMLDRADAAGEEVVGGQPLVWNCHDPKAADTQQNIRCVPDFADICMLSLEPLKLLCRRRYRRFTYADEAPYRKELLYRVPSGAFFFIKKAVFEALGFFDEGTFLYYEEHILGKKLELSGKKLLFLPQYQVRHEQGKSTGSTRYRVNRFAERCSRESRQYYVRHYLHKSAAACLWVGFLSRLDTGFVWLRSFCGRKRRLE